MGGWMEMGARGRDKGRGGRGASSLREEVGKRRVEGRGEGEGEGVSCVQKGTGILPRIIPAHPAISSKHGVVERRMHASSAPPAVASYAEGVIRIKWRWV